MKHVVRIMAVGDKVILIAVYRAIGKAQLKSVTHTPFRLPGDDITSRGGSNDTLGGALSFFLKKMREKSGGGGGNHQKYHHVCQPLGMLNFHFQKYAEQWRGTVAKVTLNPADTGSILSWIGVDVSMETSTPIHDKTARSTPREWWVVTSSFTQQQKRVKMLQPAKPFNLPSKSPSL